MCESDLMLIYVVLILICSGHRSWCRYDRANVAAGTKLAANEDILVSASNAFSNFAIIIHPFKNDSTNGTKHCDMRFSTDDQFVHSVAVMNANQNNVTLDTFRFAFIAESMSTMISSVCIASISKATCMSTSQCIRMATGESPQEHFLLAVDTTATFVYGFTSSFVFKLDVNTNRIVLNRTTNAIWPSLGFLPRAVDIADSWAVIAGYGYLTTTNKDYNDFACLIDLAALTSSSCVVVNPETTYIVPSEVTSFNDLYEMSVAIHRQKILIGIHRLESVVLLENTGVTLIVTNTHVVRFSDASSFGRDVSWIDNSTFAVLTYNGPLASSAKSTIFIFDQTAVNSISPLYTFPNHQQIVGSRLSNPFFVRMVFTKHGNMAVLTNHGDLLIIPIAPVGYTSTWIETVALEYIFKYVPTPCIAGTYKNISGIGHCHLCPPGTRNPGTFSHPMNVCMPCAENSSTSFCPLASLVDIDLRSVPSISQATDYPETDDTTDIEDILLQNIFQVGSELRCKLISPVLWTSIVGLLCLLIGLVMILLKRCRCKPYMPYRNRAKLLFKHTDIIGEGEMWVGGLATFAVLVLIVFSYWFAGSFLQRYPIEEVLTPAKFACNPSLVNAKFSSGLQLLALARSTDVQRIFTLLDQQRFNLTIDLVNTGFLCESVTAQENFVDLNHVHLSIECTRSVMNAITSVTFPLPSHSSSVQINITGPQWIGGIRLCIRASGLVEQSSTLRELDFCEFYSTANQTIGRKTIVPINLVKNINITRGLDVADETRYSGLWIPTVTSVKLSDEAYYAEAGNYLRYIPSLTVIQVIFDERPFFVKNVQEPITRKAELIFHSLLFTLICIEMFGFVFLLVKLLLVPLLRWIENVLKQRRDQNKKNNDDVEKETVLTSIQVTTTERENDICPISVVHRNTTGESTVL